MIESRFKGCGPIAEQLYADVETMGISDEYIERLRQGWDLPMSFGFKNGRYFAEEPAERRNGWVTLFDSADSEEFRWYILENIARGWGQKCEREQEPELVKQWDKSGYGYEYDWRKAWWEFEIDSLRRIYDIADIHMQKLISSYEQYLRTSIDENTKIVWRYDVDSRKFVSSVVNT